MPELIYQKDEILEAIEETGLKNFDPERYEKLDFKDLMRFRIDKILMICSLYDFYTIIEDGRLQEAIFNEYLELNLHYAPHITRVSGGATALQMLDAESFDLVIVTLRLGDMSARKFSEKMRKKYPGTPCVLLASQSRELQNLLADGSLDLMNKVFVWAGDRRVFLAIIKLFEDEINAPLDCLEKGVTAIILVEDSPSFYSAYLPLIYTEIMQQSQKLIEESKNSAQKLLRQRARPKIFHAADFEQAMNYFAAYRDVLLGIITDMKFQMDGKEVRNAGIKLIERVKKEAPFLPILLQSSNPEAADDARKRDVGFINKNSRTLLRDLREFMWNNFGFGDFIFRLPTGEEVARAKNIRDLRDKMRYVPNESLLFHAKNNHFSHWLIARTEFELAKKIRPIKVGKFKSVRDLRDFLIKTIRRELRDAGRGVISVFTRETNGDDRFEMIGEGSLGGKARGLAFIDNIIKTYLKPDYFPGVEIAIPRTVVLGTDVFANFMEMNDLYPIAVQNISDEHIHREFQKADLPPTVLGDLREILKKVKYPIAVRSSSLLEDAVYQPFAGVYATVMIPNSSTNIEVRFANLVQAIKYVYASTFSRNSKNYIEATGNIIEEEKMAVILQEMIGQKFENYFYPHFSGVAKSYNYYPFGKAKPTDGIVNLALGLGKTIVDGGTSLHYAPPYPRNLPQFGSTKDIFAKSQLKYWAVDLNSDIIRRTPSEDRHLTSLGIQDADRHGALKYVASTYVPGSDIFYEGVMRDGPRAITFAPILQSKVFELNRILKLVLKISEAAMNSPVEIEFACILGEESAVPAKFGFLQVRPMVKPDSKVDVDISSIPKGNILLYSEMALGNGSYDIKDVIYVKPDSFSASRTRLVAEEVRRLNKKMLDEKRHYILIGPGRWGSSDPWLGVPIDFSAISHAQAVVETPMPHMVVDPSQGSHFFHNMTSFKMMYFTVREYHEKIPVDWDWLDNQIAETETTYLRLVRLPEPLEVKVDGRKGLGVALKKKK